LNITQNWHSKVVGSSIYDSIEKKDTLAGTSWIFSAYMSNAIHLYKLCYTISELGFFFSISVTRNDIIFYFFYFIKHAKINFLHTTFNLFNFFLPIQPCTSQYNMLGVYNIYFIVEHKLEIYIIKLSVYFEQKQKEKQTFVLLFFFCLFAKSNMRIVLYYNYIQTASKKKYRPSITHSIDVYLHIFLKL
jgi:hypothetical protein